MGVDGKLIGARSFLEWRRATSTLDISVVTDGSTDTNGLSGGGDVIDWRSSLLTLGSIPLGDSVEAYDAEISAAVTRAQVAMEIAEGSLAENTNRCLDKEAAAIILAEEYKDASGYNHVTKFADLKKN